MNNNNSITLEKINEYDAVSIENHTIIESVDGQSILILQIINRDNVNIDWIKKNKIIETSIILYNKLKKTLWSDEKIIEYLDTNTLKSKKLHDDIISHMGTIHEVIID